MRFKRSLYEQVCMMPDGGMAAGGGSKVNIDVLDAQITDLILKVGQNTLQPMPQAIQTVTPTAGTALTLQLQSLPVGLLKGYLLECTATLTNNSGSTANLTEFGPANLLSNISFWDLSNYLRINTAGWHLAMVNAVKRRRPYGMAQTLTSSPIGYGNNYSLITAPATISASGSATVKMFYYVPITYTDHDLRGCINLGVTNANVQFQITINPNAFVASGDSTLAVYSGNPGSITSFTVKAYQHYIDQLPRGQNGGVILPPKSNSLMYMLLNSNLSGMTVGQDFPIPYANWRDFLSTLIIFDNGGTLNAGSDINYWALQAANTYNYYKADPFVQALLTRNEMGVDLPTALYYFNHRGKVLNTQQWGNQSLVLNASTVNSNAVVLFGYEMFAGVNAVLAAQSLPGG